MKKIVFSSIVLCLLIAVLCKNSSNAFAAAAPKPMKGQIVSLDDIIKGKKDLQLTKEKATELYEQKVPIVFLYNKKIYFVQTEDGSFAFRKLSDFAHNKFVGIKGKTKTVNGLNVIIMSYIDAMN